jgi:hypothetical protein
MKRIGIVGLSVVTMFAFGAMAASSAFAGEYITCVKVSKEDKKFHGRYTDNTCAALSATSSGKYERGSPTFPIAFTSKSKVATLSSDAGRITCKESTGKGTLLSATTGEGETTFTECESGFGPCTNLSAYEETGKFTPADITTLTLTTLIDHGEKGPSGLEPAEGEVWSSSAPDPASPLYPYELVIICEPGFILRTGDTASAVLAPVLAKASNKGTFALGEGKGEQDLVSEFSENGGETWNPTGANVETLTSDIKTASDVEVADGTP